MWGQPLTPWLTKRLAINYLAAAAAAFFKIAICPAW
jgi:hypothetical protein